jgi:prephenate dehydrogenase
MFDADFWEIASYVVTVFALPLAIVIFIVEQGRERRNEEDEVYQLLSNAYNDFLRVVIDNPDLHLRSQSATLDLSAEQQERMLVVFDMLISLLERAYLTAYSSRMSAAQRRRWNSWEDFMREWVR